ncbi:MAG: cytochrome c [Chloroflexi bacterium]|nr:cytochrome c [Chloroflexota bacterium]
MLDSKRLWIGIGTSLLLVLLLSACASYPQVKAPEPTNTPLPAAPTEPPATATAPVPTAAPAPTATAVPPTEAPANTGGSSAEGNAEAGAKVYASTCAACHGQKGEGVLGPKLAGTSLSAEEIVTIVKNGKPDGGMPAFGAQLDSQAMQDLAAFILTLGK